MRFDDFHADLYFFSMIRRPPRSTLFPTRRSSDLLMAPRPMTVVRTGASRRRASASSSASTRDRKSTRLNSSHTVISYAVFCLKKKMQEPDLTRRMILDGAGPNDTKGMELISQHTT